MSRWPRTEEEYMESLRHRIKDDSTINTLTGCWNWNKSLGIRGYGKIGFRNRSATAHRVSYLVYKGEIKKNQLVMHKCDNPKCVNPEHLNVGSYADNTQDSLDKGRTSAKGTRNTQSKLTEYDVSIIKKLVKESVSQRIIARTFNVCPATICHIKKENNWKQVI